MKMGSGEKEEYAGDKLTGVLFGRSDCGHHGVSYGGGLS